jgi:hypothetical protein
MSGSAKALKRNNGKCEGILIGPQWPLVSPGLDSIVVFLLAEGRDQLRFKICGADGKLTIEPFKKRESIWMTGACNHPSLSALPLIVDELIHSAAAPTWNLGKSQVNGKSGTYEALSGALGSV